MDNLSPFEVYAIKLHGDDATHLRQLLASKEIHTNCLACRRIEKAAALAEFIELDPPERVA